MNLTPLFGCKKKIIEERIRWKILFTQKWTLIDTWIEQWTYKIIRFRKLFFLSFLSFCCLLAFWQLKLPKFMYLQVYWTNGFSPLIPCFTSFQKWTFIWTQNRAQKECKYLYKWSFVMCVASTSITKLNKQTKHKTQQKPNKSQTNTNQHNSAIYCILL